MVLIATTTTSQNLVRKGNIGKTYPIVTGATVSQGDLVVWSSADLSVNPMSTDALAATLVGQVQDQFPAASGIDGAATIVGAISKVYVQRCGIVTMKATAGQTYTEGQALFAGADAQTVTNVAGVNKIGYVALDGVASQGPAVAGDLVNMDLVSQFPQANVLGFLTV